jgi:type II restriction enzyme
VEAVGKDYSLVADAKVFRLSRTAKNQKDFKIEAMHGWKRGRPHAMVVCPIYQLPARSSQIYQQAINRSVCIFSYSHLAIVVQLASKVSGRSAQGLLVVLRGTETLNPTKDSIEYWTNINRTMLKFHPEVERLWRIEKIAMAESLTVAKQEALNFLAEERERVMRLSHKDAIALLVKDRNVDGRERVIRDLEDNGILSMG